MPASGFSSVWLERLPWAQEVAGSNPAIPTMNMLIFMLALLACSIFLNVVVEVAIWWKLGALRKRKAELEVRKLEIELDRAQRFKVED